MLVAVLKAPHFTVPFNIDGKHFMENEQGTIEDVVSGVRSVLLTEPGERELLPDFGLRDPSFTIQGASAADIAEAVALWEPRARSVAQQNPEFFLSLLGQVDLTVHGAES